MAFTRVPGLCSLLSAYPVGKRPYPFQLEGTDFLAKRDAALLGDEMGLGKTIQAILAMRAKIHAGEIGRVLVVCPKSLLPNWHIEVTTRAPELSIRVVHGPRQAQCNSGFPPRLHYELRDGGTPHLR